MLTSGKRGISAAAAAGAAALRSAAAAGRIRSAAVARRKLQLHIRIPQIAFDVIAVSNHDVLGGARSRSMLHVTR